MNAATIERIHHAQRDFRFCAAPTIDVIGTVVIALSSYSLLAIVVSSAFARS